MTLRRAARARSGTGCPRRGRAARSCAAPRARSGGTARHRSSRRRRSRAPSPRPGRRPRGRAPSAPARGRARPRRAPRASAARSCRDPGAARTRSAACAPLFRARGTRAPRARASTRERRESRSALRPVCDSSRMRGRSACVSPRTRTPSMRRPRLRGSSSRKPTGDRPSSRLRAISRSTSRPPSPAPTISTAALTLAHAAQRRQRPALVDHSREHAHADQEQQAEQEEQARSRRSAALPWRCRGRLPTVGNAVHGEVALHRAQHLDRERPSAARSPRSRAPPPRSRAGSSSASDAGTRAQSTSTEQAADEHPPDRAVAQLRVVAGRTVVEAQLEREVVGERDQHPVDGELRDGAAMQGNRAAVRRRRRITGIVRADVRRVSGESNQLEPRQRRGVPAWARRSPARALAATSGSRRWRS